LLERARGARVVGALVAADSVVDLEGVGRDRLERVERDDLAIRRDAAQVTRERGDAALAGRVGRDEGGADDGANSGGYALRSNLEAGLRSMKRKSGPS